MAGPKLLNGRPIYQPLTPAQEAGFLDRLAICEAVWRETGEPLVVTYALTLTYLHAQTVSVWLEAAQVEASLQQRTPDQAKTHRKAMCYVMRYMIVRDLLRQAKAEGRSLSVKKACRLAGELLVGTAFGSVEPETIEESYRQVRADFRNGTARAKYFLFSDKRYLDADADGFVTRFLDAEGKERPKPAIPDKLSVLRGRQK